MSEDLKELKTDTIRLQNKTISTKEVKFITNVITESFNNIRLIFLSTTQYKPLDFCKINEEGAKILGEGLSRAFILKALYLGTYNSHI